MQQTTAERTKSVGLMKRMGLAIAFTRFDITEARTIGENFRHIRLRLDGKGALDCRPGDKIQISMGSVWTVRTYTPFAIDSARRSVDLLVYTKAGGPGTLWAVSAKAGDEGHVFGPRRSLPVEHNGPTTLFGDETSFAMAIRLSGLVLPTKLRLCFEVDSIDEASAVLSEFNLSGADLLPRQPNDAHLARFLDASKPSPENAILLTGRAGAIQSVRKALSQADLVSRPTSVAYWAEGKAGLD